MSVCFPLVFSSFSLLLGLHSLCFLHLFQEDFFLFLGLAAIAIRVRNEDDATAARIAAWANEALTRNGFRPDSTAPATLLLSIDRPRSLSARSGPNVGVVAQG